MCGIVLEINKSPESKETELWKSLITLNTQRGESFPMTSVGMLQLNLFQVQTHKIRLKLMLMNMDYASLFLCCI